MSSEQGTDWGRVLTGAIILVGFGLLARLGYMYYQSNRAYEPRSVNEVHELLRKGAMQERENWERDWRASGRPEPAGGFEAAWQRARGKDNDEELLLQQEQENQKAKDAATTSTQDENASE